MGEATTLLFILSFERGMKALDLLVRRREIRAAWSGWPLLSRATLVLGWLALVPIVPDCGTHHERHVFALEGGHDKVKCAAIDNIQVKVIVLYAGNDNDLSGIWL